MGALAAFSAAILTVEQRGNASVFGLVLSYALQITMLTSMTVRVLGLLPMSWLRPRCVAANTAYVHAAVQFLLLNSRK